MLNILKFHPIYKERLWGGRLLEQKFNKRLPVDKNIGESWELSGVEGDISVVSNGTLSDNTLQELIEVYMGDLVGEKVYEQFGDEFPLLIKLIDARDNLSIQVHPDDELAMQRHHSYGKTEMWYILDNEPDAQLYVGFNQPMTREKYIGQLENGTLESLLMSYNVKRDDAFFIPAGTIHAIGRGIVIAEIQQTSDITYRVYDFNRVDTAGKQRELHTELALDAIDYSSAGKYDMTAEPKQNEVVKLAECRYFVTNTLRINGTVERDYAQLDSFVIYICTAGQLTLETEAGTETIHCGETVLVPAIFDSVLIQGNGQLIETYIP